MSTFIEPLTDGFIWRRNHEQVWVQAWGKNAVRVRITREAEFKDLPNGLLDNPPKPGDTNLEHTDDEATLTNGNLTINCATRFGRLTFTRTSDGQQLLQECKKTTAEHHGRTFVPQGGTFKVEHRFVADEAEKIYGMGQRQHGMLNQKGCVLDLMHRNTEVSIPFMVSSKGYGFLWNHPGLGQVSFGRNETRWTADALHQLDFYVVCEDDPGQMLQRYAQVTGMPSAFPEWAAGFWQCKLRYKTQEELLQVAREYHQRKLPVSVMVIDFHHWKTSGDWSFDPECWPDPKAMVEELESMGMKCMVSIWPTVNVKSENFHPMKEHGLLLRNERGAPWQNAQNLESFYDATHPDARTYLMEQVKKNYIDHGIRYFWLDTMEPELVPLELDNTRFHLGTGNEVAGLYPKCHFQAFYEGLKEVGEEAPLTLGRSTWVGGQSYGGAVWSADIPSTFESLQRQVAGGLNIALSGIPHWTTDIGGFHGGDIDDPDFRELLVRWFQYGTFCPIMRLHGVRRQKINPPTDDPGKADPNHPNTPNEVWSYGQDVEEILSDLLRLRDKLKPYIMEQMKTAEQTGMPPMRPLLVDFHDDANAWDVEDQFMFGPDLLVAPVLNLGQREREVYLPAGTTWTHAWTGDSYDGGQAVEVDAPLEQAPVFVKKGAKVTLK